MSGLGTTASRSWAIRSSSTASSLEAGGAWRRYEDLPRSDAYKERTAKNTSKIKRYKLHYCTIFSLVTNSFFSVMVNHRQLCVSGVAYCSYIRVPVSVQDFSRTETLAPTTLSVTRRKCSCAVRLNG